MTKTKITKLWADGIIEPDIEEEYLFAYKQIFSNYLVDYWGGIGVLEDEIFGNHPDAFRFFREDANPIAFQLNKEI